MNKLVSSLKSYLSLAGKTLPFPLVALKTILKVQVYHFLRRLLMKSQYLEFFIVKDIQSFNLPV